MKQFPPAPAVYSQQDQASVRRLLQEELLRCAKTNEQFTPARFVLIGSGNPEEGELRPQLLDRFGLAVDVHASREVPVRSEVIRQRLAYEADPVRFSARYAEADRDLAVRIAAARARVPGVALPDAELNRIAALCAAFDVDGMRADLVVARTAVAHAAWRGSDAVTVDDIRVAAEFALPHRRRRDPFDEPGLDRDTLDQALADAGAQPEPDPEPDPDPPGGGQPDPETQAPQGDSGSPTAPAARPSAPPAPVFKTRALRVPGVGEGAPGRRSRARNRSGAVVAVSPDDSGDGLHLFATLLGAAGRATGPGAVRPAPGDVRRAIREGREGNLVVFVVDASGSMAARDRMSAVSGAALSLLRDAYQRRDQVAVITFRGGEAGVLLPPTSSAHIAGRRLARFDTGGRTPLAAGLLAARDLVARQKVRDPSRRALVVVLTDGRATGGARHRLRSGLVTAEIALALILLLGAGLLIKSFWQLRQVKPGFNPEHLLTLRIDLPEARYRDIPKQAQYRRALLEQVNSLPGAQAALISELPMSGDWLTHDFLVEGQTLAEGTEPDVGTRSIEGNYFGVMQIPLLSGRDFTPQDNDGAPLVGIANESLVRRFFKDQNPLGKRVRWARDEQVNWITIVGVVADVKHFGLDQDEFPSLYTPYTQSGRPWKRWMSVAVRSGLDTATLIGAVKSRVWQVDAGIPTTKVQTMQALMGQAVEERQFNMLLLGIFATVALVLAAVGIYGVIAYFVTQRTHEIGVRMALGARANDVARMIMGRGLSLALYGIGIGVLASLALTRLMSSMLYGVSPTDPATYLVISLLLLLVALLACYLPARRATKVDPMIALRYE